MLGLRRFACPTRQRGSGNSWGEPGGGRDRRPILSRPRRIRHGSPTRADRPARPDRCCSPAARGAWGHRTWCLNLAIALGEMGQRVLVVDADLGLANLDLLCGLAPRYDLGDVLAGRCTLGDAVMDGTGCDPDRSGCPRDPDRCGGPGRRPGPAGDRPGRAGVGVRLRAGGCRIGPGPGCDRCSPRRPIRR